MNESKTSRLILKVVSCVVPSVAREIRGLQVAVGKLAVQVSVEQERVRKLEETALDFGKLRRTLSVDNDALQRDNDALRSEKQELITKFDNAQSVAKAAKRAISRARSELFYCEAKPKTEVATTYKPSEGEARKELLTGSADIFRWESTWHSSSDPKITGGP